MSQSRIDQVDNISTTENTKARMSVVGNSDGDIISITGDDDEETERAVMHRSSEMSLDSRASSTRFSSPMSLNDFQFNSLLENNDSPELEFQDWDSDKDNTQLEVANTDTKQESHSSTSMYDPALTEYRENITKSYQLSNDRPFIQEPDLIHCSDLAENLTPQMSQESVEQNKESLSLDGSVLDRSGILYYDPIDDSDEGRLVIVSRASSESTLIGEDETVTETVPRGDSSSSSCDSRTVMTTTVPKLQQSDSTHAVPTVEMRKLQPKDSATLVSKNDLSSITSRFATERASRLDTNANDLGKLLQSYQKYSETKHKKFADTGNGDGTNLQESSLVKGFQESYTTSLVCSQLANKALEVIKEAEYQKEPYQLSAMMLTGVLNILVQQANLASTICSELLNSTEVRQTELQDISGTTDAHKLLSVVATEPAVDCQSSFDAKTEIAKITAYGNELGNSDPSDNDLRLNSSVAKCSTFASHSTKNNLTYLTTNCISKQSKPDDGLITKSSSECSTKIPSSPTETSMDHGAKSQTAGNKHNEKMLRSVDIDASTEPRSGSTSENGSQAPDNIPVPKSTEKSANHKSSIELKNHIFNRDTKQLADGEELQLSVEKSMVCRKEVKNVKTEDVEYKKESGHKNKSEQITDSSVQSFIYTTTCDIACSDQERKMKKEKNAENDASMSITDIEDGTIDVTTDNLSISSKLTSPERKTPDLLETQASCGTQVTEDELETLRYESEKYKVQPTDNSIQKHSKNKLFREDKHSTQSNKTKDKKTRKSIHNQLQPPTGKRNLFESLLLETEEKVVESPSKYRKLQFGKLPQSHAKDRTHLVTPGGVSSKGLMGTVKTRSLSKQKCGDGTKNGRPEYEITQESKRTPKPDVSNKIASNTSVVLASSKPPTENKSKATPVLKSIKRSSSVPSSTHCSSDKEKNNSKSRYHSNCCLDNQGDSDNPCQESRNHHKNNALQRHFQRNSDGKVSQRVSVVLHDCKRVIGKHTEVNKTPSKRKLNMNKEDTLLQSGEDKPYRSNDGKQKTNSANLTDSKERLPAPKNKYTEESDLKDAIHKCQEADVPYSKHSSNCLHIGSLQENVKHDKTGQKTSNLDEHTESHSFCSDPMSSIVPEVVEANSCIITPQDKTCVLQDQARDEEIFKCLSFSDSDDDVPLARISESLRDGQCEGVSIVNSVDESEEDQLPKLAVPNARNNLTHRSRHSRCERPDLKTYLQIRNSLPETTWRNSLMPPPLEAERRSKSCENTIPSTSAENLDLSAIGTTPESEVISGNQSSDGTHESDLEQVQLCDGEGQSGNGDNTDRGVFTSKKKRHRRRKSDKPVASSSSEECIPKGRKRGFQWKQECLRILDRVYNHHLSDPFRHEVKSKDIPDYYKIVKRGMCFDIIGYKLRGNIYEELRDFFLDVRLMFDNCRLYYKPESPIYQASLVVKCFFRKVSKEVLMPRTTARSRQPS